MAEGHLQIEGEVIHVVVSRCLDVTGLLRELSAPEDAERRMCFIRGGILNR